MTGVQTCALPISAARAGVRWDSEVKACFFEKRPGQALPFELEGFEPKQFSWEEKIQRELNGGAFSAVPAQKSITLRPHQLAAVEAIFSAYKNGYPGFRGANSEPGRGQAARRKRKRFTSFCLILT